MPARLYHPRKSLTIAGVAEPALVQRMRQKGLLTDDVTLLGHVPQHQLQRLMSRSHALVLPSVEEGLAMVMAQALACACPVVATPNSGAADLFRDGAEGFIVPARSPDMLAERLQRLADDPHLQSGMRRAARARVQGLGGWSEYGERATRLYRKVA